MWQMWEESCPKTVSHPWEGVPQLWEEEPLDRDVSHKKKLLNWMHTITTLTTEQTEKAIGRQAVQQAAGRRREGRWQALQERRHSQQRQERRRPSQEDTLAKTGNF